MLVHTLNLDNNVYTNDMMKNKLHTNQPIHLMAKIQYKYCILYAQIVGVDGWNRRNKMDNTEQNIKTHKIFIDSQIRYMSHGISSWCSKSLRIWLVGWASFESG